MPHNMTPARRRAEEAVISADVSVRSSINALKVAVMRLDSLRGSMALIDHEDTNIRDVIDSLLRHRTVLRSIRRNRLAKRARVARQRVS